MNKADAIITEDKAKANKQVQAEQALSTANIKIITQQHQNTMSKEQRENDAVHAATSVESKELIQSITSFQIRNKQKVINDLREKLRTKKQKLTELSSKMKTDLHTAAIKHVPEEQALA